MPEFLMWTIIWALLAFLSQVGLSWLGWTMNHETISPRKRKWAHIGFITLAIFGSFSVAVVTYRSTKTERAHFETYPRLSTSWSKERPDSDLWSMAQEWLPVNSPAELNLYYVNVGSGPAANFTGLGRVYIEPDEALSSTRDAVDKFNQWFNRENPVLSMTTVPPNQLAYFTANGDIVTPDDLDNITHGRRVLYLVGILKFDDDLSSHIHNVCWLLRPPQVGGIIIPELCKEHTDEK
jgi:hypothetical protein